VSTRTASATRLTVSDGSSARHTAAATTGERACTSIAAVAAGCISTSFCTCAAYTALTTGAANASGSTVHSISAS
jgi:hypothetical protein